MKSGSIGRRTPFLVPLKTSTTTLQVCQVHSALEDLCVSRWPHTKHKVSPCPFAESSKSLVLSSRFATDLNLSSFQRHSSFFLSSNNFNFLIFKKLRHSKNSSSLRKSCNHPLPSNSL